MSASKQKLSQYEWSAGVLTGAFFCALALNAQLAERIEKGAATITVHPRGAIETARALAILEDAGAVEVISHDLANQVLERAAAKHKHPWIHSFWR